MAEFPYAEQFGVNRTLPEDGFDKDTVLSMLSTMSSAENPKWEAGQCSGTMYCGDHEHYDFVNAAFGLLLPRQRAAARHVPERDQVRGRDHRDDARPARRGSLSDDAQPAGLVTTGGTSSIAHAVLAYREHAAPSARATQPDQARDGAPRLRQGRPPLRRRDASRSRRPDRRPWSTSSGWPTTSTTTRRARRLGLQLRLRHHRSDRRARRARTGARRRTARRRLPRGIPASLRPRTRLRHRALRLLRAGRDVDLGRHPQVRLRLEGHERALLRETRRCATASTSSDRLERAESTARRAWTARGPEAAGGDVGGDGAASGATGYRRYARRSSRPRRAMQDAVRSHDALRILGDASFLFSFTSDEFDVYHVNDLLRTTGMATQRPAVPERAPHGSDAPPDPARRRRARGPPTSPTPSPTRRAPREAQRSPARSTAASWAG